MPRHNREKNSHEHESREKPARENGGRRQSRGWKGGNYVAMILIGAVALTAGILIGFSVSGASGEITQAQASEKAVSYINSVLQGQASAKVLSINESEGLYNLKLDVGGTPYNSYMTKDGRILFPSGINLEQAAQSPAGTRAPAQTAIPKSDKPVVELFVMSLCPYGVQAEGLMKPVVDLLGSKANISVRFIAQDSGTIDSVQSLHGPSEAKQDLRQLCIMKNYPAKYWNYLSAFDGNCYPNWSTTRNATALESCWKSAEAAQGIESAKIDSCVSSDSLSLLKPDEHAGTSYGVSGSPTLMINGVMYNGARSSEGFKSAICSAFNNPPAECSQNIGASSQPANASAVPVAAASACG